MRYQITVNGPTGLELENEWVPDEDSADWLEDHYTDLYKGQLVAITVRSEAEVEDGPSE